MDVLAQLNFVKSSLVSTIEENNMNNVQSVMKQNQQIMDEDVVKGHDRGCQGLDIANPTTVPRPMMKTNFTSLLQNLHNLGKTTDPAYVKDSPSGADYINTMGSKRRSLRLNKSITKGNKKEDVISESMSSHHAIRPKKVQRVESSIKEIKEALSLITQIVNKQRIP
ncbi:hypothetical protein VNO77_44399 [Canavalia gladiata]|uniref:Uncharacterized protein n=1 Tax=Canavalia gladiata TaxID=3824 RepID=A0AAN9JWZ8_CANGL